MTNKAMGLINNTANDAHASGSTYWTRLRATQRPTIARTTPLPYTDDSLMVFVRVCEVHQREQ